jgi:hypothetical protein
MIFSAKCILIPRDFKFHSFLLGFSEFPQPYEILFMWCGMLGSFGEED